MSEAYSKFFCMIPYLFAMCFVCAYKSDVDTRTSIYDLSENPVGLKKINFFLSPTQVGLICVFRFKQ